MYADHQRGGEHELMRNKPEDVFDEDFFNEFDDDFDDDDLE